MREGGWRGGGVVKEKEGHRGTHQKQQKAKPDGGDQPFLLFPSRALGQLSNQVTSLSHVASGQLFLPLHLLKGPQPAAVAADVFFLYRIFYCAC